VVGIASMGWRVRAKNFHGKHTAGLFLKERGWGTNFPPIKGTSNPSSTCNEDPRRIYCWCACSLVSVLVPFSWMGSARGKDA